MYNLLLLCNRPVKKVSTDNIIEHIDALKLMPAWSVYELPMLGKIPSNIDLNRFDAIGVHYT
ncbi:MAG: hypothetical protein LBL40_00125, partial [Coxiellaceae bacterium]|nr:hypothetical protein [Coxiellaceae bacterium]